MYDDGVEFYRNLVALFAGIRRPDRVIDRTPLSSLDFRSRECHESFMLMCRLFSLMIG